LAYAHVPAAGGADHAKGMSASNVQTPSSGLYCIGSPVPLGFTPNNVEVTIGNDGGAVSGLAELGNPVVIGSLQCPGGTQVTVVTYSISMSTSTGNVTSFDPTPNGFYISLN
jgi:hypothetical protein